MEKTKKWLNILLGVLLVVTVALMAYAVFAPHSDDYSQYAASISLCLYWGYFLLVFGVFMALFCAFFGMAQNPKGAIWVAGSAVLIAVIIGAAYFISAGHNVLIPNLADGGYFDHTETVISESCIIVTYVAFVAAFLSALCTEVWRAFK